MPKLICQLGNEEHVLDDEVEVAHVVVVVLLGLRVDTIDRPVGAASRTGNGEPYKCSSTRNAVEQLANVSKALRRAHVMLFGDAMANAVACELRIGEFGVVGTTNLDQVSLREWS